MTHRSRQPASTRRYKRRNPISREGSRSSREWARSDPAQFLVGYNVQWTAVSNPPSQPMCARVLAGFLRSHFHDNLCTVLDEYVRAEVSFANPGVREEARALVEQGGTVTRGGCRVQWQKSYRQTWAPFTRGKGGSAQRSAPGTSAMPTPRGNGAVAAPRAPAPEPMSGSDDGDRRRSKRSRFETRERSRSPSRERRPRRHGGPRRFRSRSPLPRWPRTWIPTMGISIYATL